MPYFEFTFECREVLFINKYYKDKLSIQLTTGSKVIFLWLIYVFSANSWATNVYRELEYAEHITAYFSTGKIVWLKANDRRFLTLYTETEEQENLGTAIILHPMDGHPDQKKFINPLRTYLPQHNWATLSIQLPVLGLGAEEREYYPLFREASRRIQMAVDYLVSAGVQNIVLIGYGLGSMMAVSYLNDKQGAVEENLKAVVTISLGVPKSKHDKVQIIDFIKEITLPFLDVFAEYDLPVVTDSARKRRIAGKASQSYRQFEIEGEGHLFQHDEGQVVKRIYSWIRTVVR